MRLEAIREAIRDDDFGKLHNYSANNVKFVFAFSHNEAATGFDRFCNSSRRIWSQFFAFSGFTWSRENGPVCILARYIKILKN